MSYRKFYALTNGDIEILNQLMSRKIDGEYYLLNENERFGDIAQYCAKYNSIRIVTVLLEKLEPKLMYF